MASLVNFINNFKKDITSHDDSNECKKFFFKSLMHLMISLEIASSSILDEKITFINLQRSIPSSLGGKNEIKETLNEGIAYKFFIKKKFLGKKDYYYKISKKFSLMITNWYLENKANYN